MKKLLILAVVLGFLVSGCAGNKMWTKAGATQDQFEQDKRECLYEAEKYGFVPITHYSQPFLGGISAGLQEGMRKQQLFKQCMECRGYSLQVVAVRPGRESQLSAEEREKLWNDFEEAKKIDASLTWESFLKSKGDPILNSYKPSGSR